MDLKGCVRKSGHFCCISDQANFFPLTVVADVTNLDKEHRGLLTNCEDLSALLDTRAQLLSRVERPMSLLSNSVTVEYKGRVWEIDVNPGRNVDRGASSIALDLQAALNLSRAPVGLCLRASPGEDAVVFPLSVLIACPSYITTAFRGRSWVPLLEGGEEDESWTPRVDEPPFVPPIDVKSTRKFPPQAGSSPLRVNVPDQDLSMLVGHGSNASPSEGWGRPLTAPPGDRTRGVPRQRPGRREGLGRPLSATPSDKRFGVQRIRSGGGDGFARPAWAPPPSHANSGGSSFARAPRSPKGFRCDDGYDHDDYFALTNVRASAPSHSLSEGRRSSSRRAKMASNLSVNSNMISKFLAERRSHAVANSNRADGTIGQGYEASRAANEKDCEDHGNMGTGDDLRSRSRNFWV